MSTRRSDPSNTNTIRIVALRCCDCGAYERMWQLRLSNNMTRVDLFGKSCAQHALYFAGYLCTWSLYEGVVSQGAASAIIGQRCYNTDQFWCLRHAWFVGRLAHTKQLCIHNMRVSDSHLKTSCRLRLDIPASTVLNYMIHKVFATLFRTKK